MTIESSAGPSSHHVLPVVADMCIRINEIFVRYVGPVAHDLTEELYEVWRARGDVRPSGVAHYIQLLSQNIVDDAQRSSFRDEARVAMREALQRRP